MAAKRSTAGDGQPTALTAAEYMAQAIELCRSKPFLEAVAVLLSERRTGIASALRTGGAASLNAIAEEAATHLEHATTQERALACVGAEIGFLLGLAAGVHSSASVGVPQVGIPMTETLWTRRN